MKHRISLLFIAAASLLIPSCAGLSGLNTSISYPVGDGKAFVSVNGDVISIGFRGWLPAGAKASKAGFVVPASVKGFAK